MSRRLDLAAVTRTVQAVRQELEQTTTAPDNQLLQRLAGIGDYLQQVRRDMQRNVRPPITRAEVSTIEELLTEIIDILSLQVVGHEGVRGLIAVP
jgi:hypothetical protein